MPVVHRGSGEAEAVTALPCGVCGTPKASHTTKGTCPVKVDGDLGHYVPDPTVDCPKCGLRVDTETIVGRVRTVTTTVVHIKPGPTAKVCHAILKTEEKH